MPAMLVVDMIVVVVMMVVVNFAAMAHLVVLVMAARIRAGFGLERRF